MHGDLDVPLESLDTSPHFASLSADCHSPWAACSLTLFVACFIKLFTVFTAGFCNVLVFGNRRGKLTSLMTMIDCNDYDDDDDDDDDNADKHGVARGGVRDAGGEDAPTGLEYQASVLSLWA